MKTSFLAMTALAATLLSAPAAEQDTRLFEMRIYYAPPGKLDDLHARFRNHTTKLFEKHGMVNLGYWVPQENPDHKLIYILAYPNREARDQSWKAFMGDPEWKEVAKKTEANGRIVAKVESKFLRATDYSPAIKPVQAGTPRVFELRTYLASAGNLDALHARFRDHTIGLFSKHGMEHVGYWTLDAKEKGADSTLLYLLAHQSKEAAGESFKAFRDNPDWIKAKAASEQKAGGSLTVSDPTGVQSVFLNATDYSATK